MQIQHWKTKNTFGILFSLALLFSLNSSSKAWGDGNTRVTNPNALSFELVGRGLLYSFAYDRVLNERLAAGVGVGSVSTTSVGGVSVSATVIPVYVNFYFSESAGSLFVTAGAALVASASTLANLTSSAGSLQFSSSPILPEAGLGYEYRSDPGYLFRIAAYGILGNSLIPWGGISFGYSF